MRMCNLYKVLQCHSNETQEVKTYVGREVDKKNLGKTISFFFRNFIQRRSKQNLLLIEIREIHCLEFFGHHVRVKVEVAAGGRYYKTLQ